jgi:DUF1365 family protein
VTAVAHDPGVVPQTLPVTPRIYDTVVTHVRATPLRNEFTYKSYSWLVDLDHLPEMPWYARAFARFEGRDHFGGTGTIRAQVDTFLAAHDIDLEGGRVLMLASPRVLGYAFNPLSVHWCHRADGTLACVIAEVHNTYGERHAYLLQTDDRGRGEADKEFYVSPFYDLSGRYTMSLPEPGETLTQVVTLHRDSEMPFVASVRGVAKPATVAGLARAIARCPGASVGVAIKIRFQGIKLWLRKLPVAPRPDHPTQQGISS